ncbi:MAG: NAD-dependent succinate-semialdehyde dehydrogenase [Chloroflexota bacterium]|nr:MAG: NAD-dependent succinate-semialdehyde dehydrogenase [Chloroflexota bacterium]
MIIRSINPATEEVLASFDEFKPQQVERTIDEVHSAFGRWRTTTLAERARLFREMAAQLRQQKPHLARLITLEMGKPISAAEAEIDKCAWNCAFYAENAGRLLAEQHVQTDAMDSYVAFEPLGVVLAVMPWNFPFWQVFRFAAPALMAGNTALLKHASNVPQCALAIERIFMDAGFPPGVFRALLIPGSTVEPVIADARVAAVTLTGSDATGSRVASAGGRWIKKSVMELGGSDPFIVLADADLEAAARIGVVARFQNTGQSCIAAKRFILVEQIADEFERHFKRLVSELQVGDPLEPQTEIGPLARGDLREALERQVRESIAQGAQVELGGVRLDRRGYFYAPTILSHVSPKMPVFREETFGPVAAIVRVKDEDEAIRMANDTVYGLGASLWTRDTVHARKLAHRIQAGSVFVNGLVASDPRLPFGGIKRSGYGRELSEFGIHEFVNIQTVWIGPPSASASQPRPAE